MIFATNSTISGFSDCQPSKTSQMILLSSTAHSTMPSKHTTSINGDLMDRYCWYGFHGILTKCGKVLWRARQYLKSTEKWSQTLRYPWALILYSFERVNSGSHSIWSARDGIITLRDGSLLITFLTTHRMNDRGRLRNSRMVLEGFLECDTHTAELMSIST